MTHICGIYRIKNVANNKFYIGSSNNIRQRWNEHKSDLNRNIHSNNHLQRAYNKYGKKNFEFSIIEECSSKDLIKREQYYVSWCKLWNVQLYNINLENEENSMKGRCKESHPNYIIVNKEIIKKIIELYISKISPDKIGSKVGLSRDKIRSILKENNIKLRNRKESHIGKTWEETHGEEKAKELKKKQSKLYSGKGNPMYGKHTGGAKHPNFGKHLSKETKKKIAESLKDKIHLKKECPHCHQFFTPGNYGLWHGNKCKLNRSL